MCCQELREMILRMRKVALLFIASLALLASVSYGQEKDVEESRPLFPIKENGKWGFIHKTGKVAIEPQFDLVGIFSEGLAQVRIGANCGYIDRARKDTH
jgi:hypothetical protein